jgi:hypothetical protein
MILWTRRWGEQLLMASTILAAMPVGSAWVGSRHRRVCRGEYSAIVTLHGPPSLSASHRLALIAAAAGGSNVACLRLWKLELQKLADEIGLRITVFHFPPGTSKWNEIEHRLFSLISQNWRGKPLVSLQAIVSLIAAKTTTTSLRFVLSWIPPLIRLA